VTFIPKQSSDVPAKDDDGSDDDDDDVGCQEEADLVDDGAAARASPDLRLPGARRIRGRSPR
jgi:hypothetical protein